MFSSIVSGGVAAAKPETMTERVRLNAWHVATQVAFQQKVTRLDPQPRFWLQGNFVQFSYMIRSGSNAQIPAGQLLKLIEEVNNAVRDTVRPRFPSTMSRRTH